jgi:PAT family beta-lactamase induction signal transducer AmpG
MFLWKTALCAFIVSCFSATQDVAHDAFRIEALNPQQRGAGAGASSMGYRSGMWIAGAGALYLASYISWSFVYLLMASTMLIGMITTLVCQEPPRHPTTRSSLKLRDFAGQSYTSFLRRSDLRVLLLFIFLYKIGDTILNTLTMPFLLEIGFTKLEIAYVAKAFGLLAMMAGGVIGGIFLSYQPLEKILPKVGLMYVTASILFMAQSMIGCHLGFLFLTVGFENFASGFGTAAFIVLLSSRCTQPFTGTHFAFLTSFGSLCRIAISAFSGWLADQLPWSTFYGLTALMILPSIFLVIWQNHRFQGFNSYAPQEKLL